MKIVFVCLGNICRSPIAEYVFKSILEEKGLSDNFIVESRATSYEEDGNDIYPEAKDVLDRHGIKYSKHRSTRLEASDKHKYDLFICMEERNILNTKRIIGEDDRIIKLLDKDIEDPWYTGRFDKVYDEIYDGCVKLLERIESIQK